jgi:hypothetical protein
MPQGKTPFSPTENRNMTAFPKISLQQILNKNFMTQFQKWFSDRFIERKYWITLRNEVEALEGKRDINGTFTISGRIMLRWNKPNETEQKRIDNNLNAMNKFAEKYKNVPMYVMLAPTPQEIYRDTIPENAPVGNEGEFIRECYEKLKKLKSIPVEDTLLKHKNEYLYYRTDHHWTSRAAYYAYEKAGDTLGYTPYPLDKFNIETVANNFRGTTYNRTLNPFVKPDAIDIYSLKTGDSECEFDSYSTDTNKTQYNSIYFPERLKTSLKFEVFFDGNPPIGKIHTSLVNPDERKRRILIFKDSYANPFIPFIMRHYGDVTSMDLRYINLNPDRIENINDYDEVLFLYNVINFSEDTNLTKLAR